MSLPACRFFHILNILPDASILESTACIMYVKLLPFSPSLLSPQLLRLLLSLWPGSMRAAMVGFPWGGALRWTWEAEVRCGTGWCVASVRHRPSPTRLCALGVGRASPSAPPRPTWNKPRSPSTTCWPGSRISYRCCGKTEDSSLSYLTQSMKHFLDPQMRWIHCALLFYYKCRISKYTPTFNI